MDQPAARHGAADGPRSHALQLGEKGLVEFQEFRPEDRVAEAVRPPRHHGRAVNRTGLPIAPGRIATALPSQDGWRGAVGLLGWLNSAKISPPLVLPPNDRWRFMPVSLALRQSAMSLRPNPGAPA